MKIVLLVSSMHAGGAERVATTLVNAWAARGDSVTLVPTYSSRGSCFYPVSDDVDMVWLADRAGTRKRGLMASWRRLRALRLLIRDKSPDVVVSFLTNVNIAAILATRGLRIPLIVCERTHPAAGAAAGRGWRVLRRLLYPCADMVTVQARATVAALERQVPGLKRLGVIPNPLPPELTDAPAMPACGTGEPRKRLMAMGRLVAGKQFEPLADSFAALAPAYPDWDLWIWGEGPRRAALESRIAALGLDHRIRLPGRTDTPWDELSHAQAFVLSSAAEGFPNALLEAMALGLPCVAFDCPSGPRDMTRDGQDALLVPAGDFQALSQALQRLLDDSALRTRLGARAALSVRSRYALPAVLAQWDDLFQQVCAPRVAAGPLREHP